MLPHFAYPSPVRLRSHCRVVHQSVVMHLSSVLRRLQSAWRVAKAHPRALAAKASVGKATAAIQASGVEVAIGTAKRVHLRIAAQVLAPGERAALRLTMGREPRLVKRSADAWSGAEAPDLRRHLLRQRRAVKLWRWLLIYVWQRWRSPLPDRVRRAWCREAVRSGAAAVGSMVMSALRPV